MEITSTVSTNELRRTKSTNYYHIMPYIYMISISGLCFSLFDRCSASALEDFFHASLLAMHWHCGSWDKKGKTEMTETCLRQLLYIAMMVSVNYTSILMYSKIIPLEYSALQNSNFHPINSSRVWTKIGEQHASEQCL